MKRCAIISCYIVNEYRKNLVQNLIDRFNDSGIDVILASSDHIQKMRGVKNYITCRSIINQGVLSSTINAYYSTGNMIFYIPSDGDNFYSTYFFRMYRIACSYAKDLGYDYLYFIEQDFAINERHASDIFGDGIDLEKFYAYQPSKDHEYLTAFFHGNLNVLCDLFSNSNIAKLNQMSKDECVLHVEAAFTKISKDHTKLSLYNMPLRNIFSKNNLFSFANQANIFFDSKNKRYIFLQIKGSTSLDSIFSAELLLDNEVVYSNTYTIYTAINTWNIVYLEPNRNYTVKCYDAHISPETLSKTTKLYTDINNVTTKNYVEYV